MINSSWASSRRVIPTLLEPFELRPGEAVPLLPGIRHRMTAIEDTVILEASTTELAYICSQELLDFHIDTSEMQAFTATLQVLRSKCIEVAVIPMPVSSQYIASHPRGIADFDARSTTPQVNNT